MAKSSACGYRKHARCADAECDCRCHNVEAIEAALFDAEATAPEPTPEPVVEATEAEPTPEAEPVHPEIAALEAMWAAGEGTSAYTGPSLGSLGSAVVAALERCYGRIRMEHPELPPVVFVTGSGRRNDRRLNFGHFRKETWTTALESGKLPEMAVSGEALSKGAVFVVETMVHEAAHGLAAVRGIQDVRHMSNGMGYHNDEFRKLAMELGMEWPEGEVRHRTLGFSEMRLLALGQALYSEAITELDQAITAFCDMPALVPVGAPGAPEQPEPTGPTSAKGGNRNAWKLECRCGRSIRAHKGTAQVAPIICGKCATDVLVANNVPASVIEQLALVAGFEPPEGWDD